MFARYQSQAPISYRLILINVAVFVATSLLVTNPDLFLLQWGLVPARLTATFSLASLATLFTSMFLHAGLWHLLGNLIFLYFFGRLAEQRLGSRRFLVLYLLSGLAAAFAQIAINPTALAPMIGASGAISGALGAAVVLAPRQRVVLITPLTLFIPITLSIATFGLLWLGLQFFGALGAPDSGIAFAAHLGGFVGGFLLTRLWRAAPRSSWRIPSLSDVTAPRRPRRIPSAARPGAAPSPGFQTITVTDRHGRVFIFHERR